MTMTRRDYQCIATILGTACCDANNGPLWEAEHKAIIKLAHRFADTLKEEYPNFNKARFLKACLGE